MALLHLFDLLGALLLSTLVNTALAGNASLPSYPLAVKSPYLSAWVPGQQLLNSAATAQPEFWNGVSLTWPVLARVNGHTYTLFGAPHGIPGTKAAHTVGVKYTSSHTLISLTAGSVDVSLDFFSPVLPGTSDYAQQSLPYSYLTVNVTGRHKLQRKTTVEVFSAIDYSWTGQNKSAALNYTTTGSTGFFQFYNPNATLFTEVNEQASYGSVLFGASTTNPKTTAVCADPTSIYHNFTKSGTLHPKPTCAAADLAAIVQTVTVKHRSTASVTFVVGLDRVHAIDYLGETQTGYHRTRWPTPRDAVPYVVASYEDVYRASLALDAAVRAKAEAVSKTYGGQYADILEASVRQTFGALELTVPLDCETCVISAFLKEISSDGNVNTVDLIFQSWQIFVSLNPEYIAMLVRPILSYLNKGTWPRPYVVHDIGFTYPNATGHPDGNAEHLPLAETSAMFILLLAHQKLTGDSSFITEYQTLLAGYADWLVENTLYPSTQLNAVDAIHPSPNQTALAVQGAIGLNAASELLHNQTLASYAASYAHTLYDQGLGLDGPAPNESTHFTFNYGHAATWNVLYPSFSDVFLNLSTFPADAWSMQSAWYERQLLPAGLPYVGPSTDLNYTGAPVLWGITDWNLVASAVSAPAVQAAVVKTTWAYLTNGLNSHPFGTKYHVGGNQTGRWIANKARSTVGAHFALLALEQGTWYSGAGVELGKRDLR